MPSLTVTHAPKGLEGVVATTSKICYIDGDLGVLAYRGIDIHELADNSTFEETCYQLWNDGLPTASQLKELRDRLAAERKLDPAIIEFLRTAATTPAICSRGVTSTLPKSSPVDGLREASLDACALSLTAAVMAARLSLLQPPRLAHLAQAPCELLLGGVRLIEALAGELLGKQGLV